MIQNLSLRMFESIFYPLVFSIVVFVIFVLLLVILVWLLFWLLLALLSPLLLLLLLLLIWRPPFLLFLQPIFLAVSGVFSDLASLPDACTRLESYLQSFIG